MRKFFSRFTIIIPALILFACSDNSKKSEELTEINYYTQGDHNRVAAEWEPAIGTMIAWPLSLPHQLVIELAKDNHLYTLVASEPAAKDALHWYAKWGIDPAKNTFVFAPQGDDSWWVRDWGPSAAFTPDGKMKLADGKYIYSTPYSKIQCDDALGFIYKSKDNKIIETKIDDQASSYLGKSLNIEIFDLPFINTGGNVLTDGIGTAFSTCILINENKFFGVAKEKFLTLNKNLLGFDRYNILSNFEKEGIQHIDCFMKLLDEERILVSEPPKDHALYQIYDNIVRNELTKLRSPYGRPYEILRIKSDRYYEEALAVYTNSIIINKTVYVPLFHIRQDSLALQRWREVMPGYRIKGFEFGFADEPAIDQKIKSHYKNNYGWDGNDALHCRTRAIWDPGMLFISTKRIEPEVSSKHSNIVYTTIIDYSKKGLIKDQCKLFWKINGELNWNSGILTHADGPNHFSIEIPYHKSGTTIEYYIAAASNSGRIETMPRSAPLGFYKFIIR